MATVIDFRPSKAGAARRPEQNRYSSEEFLRKSMIPASIAMGVIIVVAVAALIIGERYGLMRRPWGTWVLVTAVVSIAGLTKIIIANIFFYVLIQDDARIAEEEPPPRPPRKTVPLRKVARAIPTPRRRPVRSRRAARFD